MSHATASTCSSTAALLLSMEAEAPAGRLRVVSEDQSAAPGLVQLYSAENMAAARRYAASLDAESGRRLETILTRLESAYRWRALKPAVAPANVLELKRAFPNFAEVIEDIALHLVLARLPGADTASLALPPMLLVGPPGVGKSYFARHLCAALGASFRETSLAGNSAGFIIGGLDMGWSSGKPGVVFNTLLECEEANPFILLDEIDKAGGVAQSDPLGALYNLLEPDMAVRFRDEAVTLPVDASHIIWVATANALAPIPEPLLSRLSVFHIPLPTGAESAAITRGIWRDLRGSTPWGRYFQPHLSDDVIGRLYGESPRVIIKLLTRAAGRAIMNKRQALAPEDVRHERAFRRGMGFA